MFTTGQRVVCVDDEFQPWVYDLYTALPRKNGTYTVRSMAPGRSNPQFNVDENATVKMTAADFDIVLYLEELQNPDDPHASIKVELGFRADRFAPLQEDLDENEDFVYAGSDQEMAILKP
jgi:hypothetical protein